MAYAKQGRTHGVAIGSSKHFAAAIRALVANRDGQLPTFSHFGIPPAVVSRWNVRQLCIVGKKSKVKPLQPTARRSTATSQLVLLTRRHNRRGAWRAVIRWQCCVHDAATGKSAKSKRI